MQRWVFAPIVHTKHRLCQRSERLRELSVADEPSWPAADGAWHLFSSLGAFLCALPSLHPCLALGVCPEQQTTGAEKRLRRPTVTLQGRLAALQSRRGPDMQTLGFLQGPAGLGQVASSPVLSTASQAPALGQPPPPCRHCLALPTYGSKGISYTLCTHPPRQGRLLRTSGLSHLLRT